MSATKTDLAGRHRMPVPEISACLAIFIWLVLFHAGPWVNDTGWHLWIGRQVAAGAHLYRDILEVNPPLWFWIGAGIDKVAGWTGVLNLTVLVAMFAICALASVALIARIFESRSDRAAYYTALIAILFLSSSFALGQREQFALIVTMPYVALIARRAGGADIAVPTAVLVGLLAAPGFALKHYFALVPIFLEAWLILQRKKVTIRPEFVVLALAAAAYLALIALVTPAYFTVMVPLLRLAYGGFVGETLLLKPQMAALALIWVAVKFRKGTLSLAAQSAGIAATGWLFAYLFQGKGFDYHLIPSLGCGLAALFAVSFRDGFRQRGLALVAAGAAILAALAVPFVAGPARYDDAAQRATKGLPSGTAVFALTPASTVAWPLVEDRRFTWPSRHMTLWMLGAVWQGNEQGRSPTPAMTRLGRSLRAEVGRSIACAQPRIVLVDRRFDKMAGPNGLYGYFLGDPGFASAMRAYREREGIEYLRIFERSTTAAITPSCGPRAS